jgi:hypothetical protein
VYKNSFPYAKLKLVQKIDRKSRKNAQADMAEAMMECVLFSSSK